jgi:arylsulfatase A-like enzyme
MTTARAATDYLASRKQDWFSACHRQLIVGDPSGHPGLTDLSPTTTSTSVAITDAAISLLPLAESSPLFLWVHYFDVHEWQHLPGGEDLKGPVRYANAFRSVDRQISRLLDAIERALPSDRLVLALTADHGEYLGERGRWGHTRYVGKPAIHVPLVIRAPGVLPQRRTEAVSLVDLGPTLASAAGVALPVVDGCDLMAPGCRTSPNYIVSSDSKELAIISNDRLLVVDPVMQALELSDYRNDPRGDHNLIEAEQDVIERLLAALLGSPMARAGSSLAP